MKRLLHIIATAVMIPALFACQRVSIPIEQPDPDMPQDYELTFVLNKVMQYDPINVNGIDLLPETDFYNGLSLKLYFEQGKIAALEITEGEIPYTAYKFALPRGKVSCYFDRNIYPNAIRRSDTKDIIACYKRGQFFVPYQLDCSTVKYEYWFK
ncbi:MAG: hypothetical protein IJL91_06625 [Bacteroidales bacterium]|nr:hypothetical protein [Bacteroidales bacterium]